MRQGELRDPALYCAVFNGHLAAARVLVSEGARIHQVGANGTPWYAARFDRTMRSVLVDASDARPEDRAR